jgi:hypothetical protein
MGQATHICRAQNIRETLLALLHPDAARGKCSQGYTDSLAKKLET